MSTTPAHAGQSADLRSATPMLAALPASPSQPAFPTHSASTSQPAPPSQLGATSQPAAPSQPAATTQPAAPSLPAAPSQPNGPGHSASTITASSQPHDLQQQPTPPSRPRFPNTAARQRSSNVNVDNPELEFLKTALSSLRSTVSQQEVENKRLKETLEIRNKRIVNLEAQIGHASDLIADRDIPTHHSDITFKAMGEKIDLISKKVEKLAELHPLNNIVINSCNQEHSKTKLLTNTSHTQTDEATVDDIANSNSISQTDSDNTADSDGQPQAQTSTATL